MIKTNLVHNIRWNGYKSIALTIGNLLQVVVLVRLIEQQEFGLMAMANVILSFMSIFLDLGFSNGIIFKQEISSQQLSTLYLLNISIGFILACLILFLAPWITMFFGEPRLHSILKLTGLIIFINSFGLQYKTLLKKKLNFELIARIELLAFSISFILSIILALKGIGVMALVIAALSKCIIEAILYIIYGRKLFFLRLIFNLHECLFFIRFGAFQMAEHLISAISKNFDTILIGRVLGPEVLGGYDIIKKFLARPFQLINPILTNVTFPRMAQMQQNENLLTDFFLKQLSYLCIINFSIYFLFLFNAKLILLVFLGENWEPFVFHFKALTIYFIFYSMGNPIGSLILAKGKIELGLKWNILVSTLVPLFLTSGLRWELSGVVVSLVLMQIFLLIPFHKILVRNLINVSFLQYYASILRPLTLSFSIGVTTILINLLLSDGLLLNFFLISLFWGMAFVFFNFIFYRSFFEDVLKLIYKRPINKNQ